MKKNLITVLKKLLAAFGGEDTNSNNAVEVIDKIADSVEQGGGSSGDKGPLVLEFATTDPYTVATPITDIKAAIEAGRQVWFTYNNGNAPIDTYDIRNAEISFMTFVHRSWTVVYSSSTGWSKMTP